VSGIIKVKNIDTVLHKWGGMEYQPGQEEIIDDFALVPLKKDEVFFSDIVTKAQVSNGDRIFSSKTEAWDWVNGNTISTIVTEQPDPHPFAQPLYRTKLDAITSPIEMIITSDPETPYINEYVFYLMSDERYVSGGELLVQNFEFGDWICASVYDKDGIIPEIYRSTLCENWPIVNQYIIKKWINPSMNGYGYSKIDTRPLNAKISAGLYLAIGYHAVNTGGNRKILMNYDLTKKL